MPSRDHWKIDQSRCRPAQVVDSSQALAEHNTQSVSQTSLAKHTSQLVAQLILNLGEIFVFDELFAGQALCQT